MSSFISTYTWSLVLDSVKLSFKTENVGTKQLLLGFIFYCGKNNAFKSPLITKVINIQIFLESSLLIKLQRPITDKILSNFCFSKNFQYNFSCINLPPMYDIYHDSKMLLPLSGLKFISWSF